MMEVVIDGKLVQLQSQDLTQRRNGFYGLINLSATGPIDGRTWLIAGALEDIFRKAPTREEPIRTSLIQLLGTENVSLREAGPLPENFGDYHGDLLAAVSALRDRRALSVLLPNLATGNMATRGVAALGAAALDQLALLAVDTDVVLRNSAVRTLSQMLDPSSGTALNSGDVLNVKNALFVATTDESHYVRISAAEGLGKIPGADVTARLALIADADSYAQTDNNRTTYPVREAAQKALLTQSKR
jgi:hypothetical protein